MHLDSRIIIYNKTCHSDANPELLIGLCFLKLKIAPECMLINDYLIAAELERYGKKSREVSHFARFLFGLASPVEWVAGRTPKWKYVEILWTFFFCSTYQNVPILFLPWVHNNSRQKWDFKSHSIQVNFSFIRKAIGFANNRIQAYSWYWIQPKFPADFQRKKQFFVATFNPYSLWDNRRMTITLTISR